MNLSMTTLTTQNLLACFGVGCDRLSLLVGEAMLHLLNTLLSASDRGAVTRIKTLSVKKICEMLRRSSRTNDELE